MMNSHIRVAVLVITLATAAASVPVAACGLEGGPGDSFGAAHPGSLQVAFAAHDALNAGLLASDIPLEATLAHDRADARLRMLAASLPGQSGAASIAILLIEQGIWTRLTRGDSGWVVTEHADGPGAGEATLIASELAVRDLIKGRLTAKEAIARGLLSVNSRQLLVASLTQAYPDRPSPASRR